MNQMTPEEYSEQQALIEVDEQMAEFERQANEAAASQGEEEPF